MNYTLLYIALAVAVVHWIAATKEWKILVYITKPAVMILLILWVVLDRHYPGYLLVWVSIALTLSMAGDVFLMLPDRWFLPGLVAFLLAHVAYIIGLLQVWPALNIPTLIVAVLVTVTSYQIYRGIAAGLKRQGRESMRLPVLAYTVVISVMLFSALAAVTRRSETVPALLMAAGALLFYLSDTWNAWHRFVEPLSHRHIKVMASYHLGQILLTIGALLRYKIDA